LLTVAPPEPQIFFRATDDLLRTFELHHAYQKYVTPYLNMDGGVDGSASAGAGGVDGKTPQTPGAAVGGLDKGKGKEMAMAVDGNVDATQTLAAAGAGAEQDGDDDEQGGQGKKKKGYRHLIKGIPGQSPVAVLRILCSLHPFQAGTRLRRTTTWPPSCRFPQSSTVKSHHSH
jgi:hypothetical protein